jgi:hypothetical protein
LARYRLFAVSDLLEGDGELIAAQACHHILRANRKAQALGHLLRLIGVMSDRIATY